MQNSGIEGAPREHGPPLNIYYYGNVQLETLIEALFTHIPCTNVMRYRSPNTLNLVSVGYVFSLEFLGHLI
jgi:hypothetical protein